jgi:hypothetical protein
MEALYFVFDLQTRNLKLSVFNVHQLHFVVKRFAVYAQYFGGLAFVVINLA